MATHSRSAAPRHLLTVWNPSYTESAIDAHLAVLLELAQRRDQQEIEPEDVYVWWARLRSDRRYEPLPHSVEILTLREQIDAGKETHLYLTDYRSLYVGQITGIETEEMLAEWPGEAAHMPDYYQGRRADFWFELCDLRRLVAEDTVATIEELRKLRNTRYHGNPVSLYGGMVDLPLIVTHDDGVQWFAGSEELLDGRLWAERDAEMQGETARISRELRDNLLGPTIWGALMPATRTFLATAEATFRSRRDDPGFDFSGPAVGYAKAVEVEVNALVFPALRAQLRGSTTRSEVRVENRILDLAGSVPHQGLGPMATLLERDPLVRQGIRDTFPSHREWILGSLPPQLTALAGLRNPAAHSQSVARKSVMQLREEILGIGYEGLIVQMARARQRGAG